MSVLKEEVLRIDNGEPLQFFINRLPHAGIMVDEHWHDYYEILYIADGLSLQSINRQTRQTQPGDIVIVAPGDIHATKAISETGCMIFILIFYPSALNFENVSSGGSARLDAFLNRSCLHSGYVSSPYVHGKELSRLFSKMNEECTLQQPGHKLIVKGLIYEVLGYLSRIGETVQPKTAGDAKFQKIAQVCCFIEERYREAPSLSAAAAHFGYSPDYLRMSQAEREKLEREKGQQHDRP